VKTICVFDQKPDEVNSNNMLVCAVSKTIVMAHIKISENLFFPFRSRIQICNLSLSVKHGILSKLHKKDQFLPHRKYRLCA
jgi:hypothetical protein